MTKFYFKPNAEFQETTLQVVRFVVERQGWWLLADTPFLNNVRVERSIAAAERLLAEGDTDFTASTAYYAMFYVAEALLAERDLRFRKHGGVHAAFGKSFTKTGELDPKYH